MSADIKVTGRRSIHKEDSRNSKGATKAVHGSQEHLSDGSSYEGDDSVFSNTQSFEDSEIINDNINLSSTSRRSIRRRSIPGVRTGSPIRGESALYDLRSQSIRDSAHKNDSAPYIYVVIGCVILVSSLWLWSWNTKHIPKVEKRCTYSDLRKRYPNESDYMWKHLISGVEDVLNDRSDKPGVYLFVHNGRSKGKQLILDIATTSSSCFDSSMKPVEIKSVDFTSDDAVKDYGYVIDKYKRKTKEGNVILIGNLNEIPAEVAKSLHAICDTVSPIVRKVIIFLSLVAEHKEGKVIDTAVDALHELWEAKIKSNELDPLIARVTDQVLLLST